MEFIPHDYQKYCIAQIEEKPRVGLFLEMGLGKTVITLSAINDMLGIEIQKVLVIAPLRVAQSGWAQECQKWDHLHDIRVSRVIGTVTERMLALQKEADVYVINRENVAWLVNLLEPSGNWPFDMIVIDELSSFKSPASQRFKALRRVTGRADRIIGLTGTPAPNSLIDLWAQIYLLDQGERLGKFVGRYRDAFFSAHYLPGLQYVAKYSLRPGAAEQIYSRISDICVSMKAVDHIKLPQRVDNIVEVELKQDEMKQYREMEQNMILPLVEGEVEITAFSAAVVTAKLLQIANGAVYDADETYHKLHTHKLDALEEIIEAANGKPVLVYYSYKFDLEMIRDRLGDEGCRALKGEQDIADWNAGKIGVLLAHPDSAGHGLNLQAGGHIMVWYGLTWSLEKYQQACARLHRQGQTESVIIHHIIAKDTIDEEVLKVLHQKAGGQDALMQALKARIKKD